MEKLRWSLKKWGKASQIAFIAGFGEIYEQLDESIARGFMF